MSVPPSRTVALRRLRDASAARSARARARREALGRPEGRDLELALGRAVAAMLASTAKANGRLDGTSLRAHPDLVAIVSAATAAMGERYAPAEVASVLQARLAS